MYGVAEGLLSSVTCKKVAPELWSENASLMVKSMGVLVKDKVIKREFMRNKKYAREQIPFPR